MAEPSRELPNKMAAVAAPLGMEVLLLGVGLMGPQIHETKEDVGNGAESSKNRGNAMQRGRWEVSRRHRPVRCLYINEASMLCRIHLA